jgi:(p)ppGpp synthase/HD superfamily hydrolase
MRTELGRAIAIATAALDGQVDQGGQPKILHCLRVMLAVETPFQRLVAALHDVLEDAPMWSAQRLRGEGVSADVVRVVELLTRDKAADYHAYIGRLAQDPDARAVKLADLADNMDTTRLPRMNEQDVERLRKYHRARAYLLACR